MKGAAETVPVDVALGEIGTEVWAAGVEHPGQTGAVAVCGQPSSGQFDPPNAATGQLP